MLYLAFFIRQRIRLCREETLELFILDQSLLDQFVSLCELFAELFDLCCVSAVGYLELVNTFDHPVL